MEPQVSFTTEPERLIESDATVSFLNFSLSEPSPESGIVVNIKAPNLAEFNLSQAQVVGGEITLEEEFEQQLQSALDGTRATEIPGAAVVIVSPFGSWFGASGVASLENNIPLQPSDRFQIGSITKTFVATTALQLVEEGTLSLEDTLTTWLPESLTADIPNAENITLKNLLQHTSGVADYLDILFTQAATNPTVFLQDWQPEQLVDLIDGVDPFFEPGESWQYSNTNFTLAGLVIEAATGNNIGQEIRDRIITPLNLDNTFFAGEEEVPGGLVNGYWDFDQNGTVDNITAAGLSWAWTAGAMISNTEDLDRFARSLFTGDLLEPQTLAQMLDTTPAIDSESYSSYGLGVGTIESPDRFWYIHRGQTLGYRSNMWYSPQDDLTYIELINGFSRDNLVRDILPPFREGIADDNFNFTITEQNAQIRLPVADDGEIEGEETAIFTIEVGEGYEINPDAQTGIFTISETETPIVSLSATPEMITEADGNPVTLSFTTTGTLPAEGLIIATSALFNPQLDFQNFDFADPEQVSGIEYFDFARTPEGDIIDLWKITQPNAFIKLVAFDDTLAEEDEAYTLELLPPENFELDGYELNPQATSASVTVSDGVPNLETPEISFSIEPTNVQEGDTLTVTFEAQGEIPEEGIEINVGSDRPGALGEFLIFDEAENFLPVYEGFAGTPATNGDASGFIATMTDNTATMTLNVFDDGPNEGVETISFALLDGESYGVAANGGEVILILDDGDAQRFFGTTGANEFDASVSPEGFNGSNDLVFAGAGDDLIDTSTGNGVNRVYGQSGDDTLFLGSNDRAFGGAGDDRFFLLGGDNMVTGGADADQFWIANGEIPEATNIITDFTLDVDVLGVGGLGIGFEGLTLTEQEGNTLIAAGDDELAKLLGVNASSLSASNFVFA